jgi:hypothetical protein
VKPSYDSGLRIIITHGLLLYNLLEDQNPL